jgi:hypothetical protein
VCKPEQLSIDPDGRARDDGSILYVFLEGQRYSDRRNGGLQQAHLVDNLNPLLLDSAGCAPDRARRF